MVDIDEALAHAERDEANPWWRADDQTAWMTNPEPYEDRLVLAAVLQRIRGITREQLSALIKDAYYHARDNGGTMHTAGDDAADAILKLLGHHVPEDPKARQAAAIVQEARRAFGHD